LSIFWTPDIDKVDVIVKFGVDVEGSGGNAAVKPDLSV
jgi:hypothetical protein